MSAYIVEDDHIDALITFCIDHQLRYRVDGKSVFITEANAEEVGRILLDANVASVHHRYEGRIDDDEKNAASNYRFKRFVPGITLMQAICGVRCLDYQSCERDDWELSTAWRICQSITDHAIARLPGADECWQIRRETAEAK